MRSLWTDPDVQRYPALDADIEVDVAIVGAGLSGLGAAHTLAGTGLTVAVVDERTVASGASGRNAGFILAGPAMPYDQAVERLGREEALAVWRFTVANNRDIGDLVESEAIDCGYVRRGSMSVAASDREWEHMQRAHGDMALDGINACLVTAPDLPRPFDRMYRGGLYYAGNAEIDPARFCRGVAASLPSNVRVYERTCIQDLSVLRDTWSLQSVAGCIRAHKVILATNAFTARVLPEVPIVPVRGQVLSTERLDDMIVPFPMYGNEGYQYWRQTPAGYLIVGGWRDLDVPGERGAEEVLHDDIQRELDTFVQRVVGRSVAAKHRWAGIMGFTPDMLPLAGAWPPCAGLFVAAGYSGHGVAMAFNCGSQVARMAIGAEHDLPRSFDPARFSPLS